jgi:hypothetical protein
MYNTRAILQQIIIDQSPQSCLPSQSQRSPEGLALLEECFKVQYRHERPLALTSYQMTLVVARDSWLEENIKTTELKKAIAEVENTLFRRT